VPALPLLLGPLTDMPPVLATACMVAYGRGHLLRCPEAFSQGRKLRFKLECQDEKEIVGTGFHERAVIDPARFLAREKKAAG
jgi:predicted thioesterase